MRHVYTYLLKFFNQLLDWIKSKWINQSQSTAVLMYIRRCLIKQKQFILQIPYLFLNIKKHHIVSLLMLLFLIIIYNKQGLWEFFQLQNDISLSAEVPEKLKIAEEIPQKSSQTDHKSRAQAISKTKKQLIEKRHTRTVIRQSNFWKSISKKDRIIEARIKHKPLTHMHKIK